MTCVSMLRVACECAVLRGAVARRPAGRDVQRAGHGARARFLSSSSASHMLQLVANNMISQYNQFKFECVAFIPEGTHG